MEFGRNDRAGTRRFRDVRSISAPTCPGPSVMAQDVLNTGWLALILTAAAGSPAQVFETLLAGDCLKLAILPGASA